MATAWKTFSAAAAALLLLPGACHGQELVETCEQLLAAFELTRTQDVTVQISPAADIECATYTNMTMSSNSLTVVSSEDLERFQATTSLDRVRFEVTNGARLSWETNVLFDGFGDEGEQHNNDGGALFIGEGSDVRFLNDMEMREYSIVNERDEDSDSASFRRSGGCVWNSGSFRVAGEAIFSGCDISGAGESRPGPGGAVFVGETGFVLFSGELTITDTFIRDDGGGQGGGIFNLGRVNVRGNARFEELSAAQGGAIFNGENASFNFRSGATALFRDVSNRDAEGSAVFNLGFFRFSGPALFVDAEAPAIVGTDGSETRLSGDSAFWDFSDEGLDAIRLDGSAKINIPSSVSFVGFVGPDI